MVIIIVVIITWVPYKPTYGGGVLRPKEEDLTAAHQVLDSGILDDGA